MRLRVGYVPLTDAAPVIVAAERGFADDEGIEIALSPEPSWATLRDRLALDHLDAAHMLAPLALASALGLSGPQADIVVPLALSQNGNAITLSLALWQEMGIASDDLSEVAAAFGRVAARRLSEGRVVTLGTVHPFSCHTYQLRLFAERAGLDPRRALRLVVVPPPRTVEALRRGVIDGFCCGAPWNSIAVDAGIGRIAALGCDLVPDCPEKVLALPGDRAEALLPLVRAVHRAGLWCADTGNHGTLTEILAEKGGIGPDSAPILRTLSGTMRLAPGGPLVDRRDYLKLGAAVHRPERKDARWLAGQMVHAEQTDGMVDLAEAAGSVYRADLFDRIA